jgi:hypothetical protein
MVPQFAAPTTHVALALEGPAAVCSNRLSSPDESRDKAGV